MIISAIAALSAAALSLSAAHDQAGSSDPWAEAARPLNQDGGALTGPGADWLLAEMTEAQSVLVGEQHGVEGLARLTAALEAEFQPDVLVLEAGPWIGERITQDGVRQALAFAPYSLAFDYNGDIALIEQFQARTGDAGAVWGVDQEATAIHPYAWLSEAGESGVLRRTARGLYLKAALDAGEYIPRDHQADLAHLAALAGDDMTAAAVVEPVSVSMDVFVTWRSGARGDASARREAYMIENYDALRGALEAAAGQPPRALFKMGGAHIMEGETGPNGVMTLGEHVQRRADADGVTALHLGVRGYNPEATSYPIADLIEGQSLLLLDTRVLREAIEAGRLADLTDDQRADIYGYDALIYINPLQRAGKSEIAALQADFRSGLLTSLGLHFWPAPIILTLTLLGAALLARRALLGAGSILTPALTLTLASAVTAAVFILQAVALTSAAPGAAGPGPALLPYLAPLLAVIALADTGWRGRSGSQVRWIMGLVWAALLLWLAIAMHRWNFGGMLSG